MPFLWATPALSIFVPIQTCLVRSYMWTCPVKKMSAPKSCISFEKDY